MALEAEQEENEKVRPGCCLSLPNCLCLANPLCVHVQSLEGPGKSLGPGPTLLAQVISRGGEPKPLIYPCWALG